MSNLFGTKEPTAAPAGTHLPSMRPSAAPETSTPQPINSPSSNPIAALVFAPTSLPSANPTVSQKPSAKIFDKENIFDLSPTPSPPPTAQPSPNPSTQPSIIPSALPTLSANPSSQLTPSPSASPLMSPSAFPTTSHSPSASPSYRPSFSPSPSSPPTADPTSSQIPTLSLQPSPSPTISTMPTVSLEPTASPSFRPTLASSESPTFMPTATLEPSSVPSGSPMPTATAYPSQIPSKTLFKSVGFPPGSSSTPEPTDNVPPIIQYTASDSFGTGFVSFCGPYNPGADYEVVPVLLRYTLHTKSLTQDGKKVNETEVLNWVEDFMHDEIVSSLLDCANLGKDYTKPLGIFSLPSDRIDYDVTCSEVEGLQTSTDESCFVVSGGISIVYPPRSRFNRKAVRVFMFNTLNAQARAGRYNNAHPDLNSVVFLAPSTNSPQEESLPPPDSKKIAITRYNIAADDEEGVMGICGTFDQRFDYSFSEITFQYALSILPGVNATDVIHALEFMVQDVVERAYLSCSSVSSRRRLSTANVSAFLMDDIQRFTSPPPLGMISLPIDKINSTLACDNSDLLLAADENDASCYVVDGAITVLFPEGATYDEEALTAAIQSFLYMNMNDGLFNEVHPDVLSISEQGFFKAISPTSAPITNSAPTRQPTSSEEVVDVPPVIQYDATDNSGKGILVFCGRYDGTKEYVMATVSYQYTINVAPTTSDRLSVSANQTATLLDIIHKLDRKMHEDAVAEILDCSSAFLGQPVSDPLGIFSLPADSESPLASQQIQAGTCTNDELIRNPDSACHVINGGLTMAYSPGTDYDDLELKDLIISLVRDKISDDSYVGSSDPIHPNLIGISFRGSIDPDMDGETPLPPPPPPNDIGPTSTSSNPRGQDSNSGDKDGTLWGINESILGLVLSAALTIAFGILMVALCRMARKKRQTNRRLSMSGRSMSGRSRQDSYYNVGDDDGAAARTTTTIASGATTGRAPFKEINIRGSRRGFNREYSGMDMSAESEMGGRSRGSQSRYAKLNEDC